MPSFNQYARQPAAPREGKSLSEIFNNFTHDALRRFPALKGGLVILDMNEKKVYVDENVINKQNAVNYIANHPYYQQIRRNPDASSASEFDPRSKIAAIFINDLIDPKEINNVSEASEKRLLYVLDHELAHQTILDGNYGMHNSNGNDYNTLVGECVADAYALIRHYQRFGTAGETSDKYVDPAKRALYMIMHGDLGHFTSFVLEEIKNQKDKIDFNKLDNAQTAELARRFALKYMPSAPVVDDLYQSFAPLRKAKTGPQAIDSLVNITLSPGTDYFTFKLGNIWLKDILTDQAQTQRLGISSLYSARILRLLKETELRHAKEDVLFNLPGAKPQPPQSGAANQNSLYVARLKV